MTSPAREPKAPERSTHVRFQLGLLAVTCVLLGASFVGGEFPRDQPLHHEPTVIALPLLARVAWRRGLSDVSMAAIVLFLWLHILGARYVYSYVPYDEWTRAWFGFSLTETILAFGGELLGGWRWCRRSRSCGANSASRDHERCSLPSRWSCP